MQFGFSSDTSRAVSASLTLSTPPHSQCAKAQATRASKQPIPFLRRQHPWHTSADGMQRPSLHVSVHHKRDPAQMRVRRRRRRRRSRRKLPPRPPCSANARAPRQLSRKLPGGPPQLEAASARVSPPPPLQRMRCGRGRRLMPPSPGNVTRMVGVREGLFLQSLPQQLITMQNGCSEAERTGCQAGREGS